MKFDFIFSGERGLSPLANLGTTLLRVFAGLSMMFAHGLGKIQDPSGVIGGATKMGFPLPTVFGWAAAISEFAGAGMLALGLATRLSSFFVAFTMAVAFLGVHVSDPFEKQEKALLYLFIALLYLFKGAGDWSVDALITNKK
ncbi:MAG: DoxX family protein [Pyrinomonadaceae bacterium]